MPCDEIGVKKIPRNSSGQYSLPNGTLVTAGQVIQVSQHNPAMQDIEAALSQSLSRTGSGAMQADLDVGGFKVRNATEIGTTLANPFSILAGGAVRMRFDEFGVATMGAPVGSGRMRVQEFGNYAYNAYGAGNYTAFQMVRDIGGVATEIGRIDVTDFDVIYRSRTNTIFQTGGLERGRVDAAGTWLVGAVSIPGSGRIRVSETGVGGYCINTNGSGVYTAVQLLTVGVQVGSIVCDGAQSYFNTTSDARAKRGIADAGDFGSLIDAARVRSFDYVANGAHQRAGFVAQELREIIPEVVHVPADPEQMMAVDHSRLVPFLWAELQSVRKRLAAAGL